MGEVTVTAEVDTVTQRFWLPLSKKKDEEYSIHRL
jgi:hypothetical protein